MPMYSQVIKMTRQDFKRSYYSDNKWICPTCNKEYLTSYTLKSHFKTIKHKKAFKKISVGVSSVPQPIPLQKSEVSPLLYIVCDTTLLI